MDYLYENLGDERFQELCSALIAKDFPNSQAFPVRQPDGGRDSIVYVIDKEKQHKEFIVFQVKFVRKQLETNKILEWFKQTIEKEAIKVAKLKPIGAVQYYFITNQKGTGHFKSGTIDKINALLEKNIEIPTICLWRDDISRRLESAPMFMWSFPEILNGKDLLSLLVHSGLTENKEKREGIIKAYLLDQYKIDNEVKFRQIDLQNKLMGLFVDVPIRSKYNDFNLQFEFGKTSKGLEIQKRRVISSENEFFFDERRDGLTAASFLLHPTVQNKFERILLEGGPGQGKSTISQYLCQVHRLRILDKQEDIKYLPEDLINSPIRLPFKIDLRHLADWIDKKNPYSGMFDERFFTNAWKNTLEAFFVYHIHYHSKYDTINYDDFIAIIKSSAVLFVFDGFDEIANLTSRKSVIEFINEGIDRISEFSKSLQVVVTSRPAAFSEEIVFSNDLYPHFELCDIDNQIITEYVNKWIKASNLDEKHGEEIVRLVDEKLKVPHIKELAKSPMQLAIFLSLLKTRGESLPNKRTALYDSYIELFFNRESEKSHVVLANRDLIIDIHGYLAWVLHSEAETFGTRGIIEIDDLRLRLRDYLISEEHDPDIADQLFQVVEERVCALVSRVLGTFEFEVQPLREYFCAKYLYKTSPYSPAGSYKSGTKPERFSAIVRNLYWNNVVRFFAGCFDKGELPMLILELKELQSDELLKYTNYPKEITAQILSDYVFTQYPKSLREVVKTIIDGINTRSFIHQETSTKASSPLALPYDCGGKEVVEECFLQLMQFPPTDFAIELTRIIRSNPFEINYFWESKLENYQGKDLTTWLEYGKYLGLLMTKPLKIISFVVNEPIAEHRNKRLSLLLDVFSESEIEISSEFKELAFKAILNFDTDIISKNRIDAPIFLLSQILNPFRVMQIISSREKDNSFGLWGFLSENNISSKILEDFIYKNIIDANIDPIDKEIIKFLGELMALENSSEESFDSEIQYWNQIIEAANKLSKKHWAMVINSTIVAGIKMKNSEFSSLKKYEDLSDESISLTFRVRFARLKSGNVRYWEKQFNNTQQPMLTLLVFITWATPRTIMILINKVAELAAKLSKEEYEKLCISLEITCIHAKNTYTPFNEWASFLNEISVSDDVKYLLCYRLLYSDMLLFAGSSLKNNTLNTNLVSNLKFESLVNQISLNPNETELISQLKIMYPNIKDFNAQLFEHSMFGFNINRTEKMTFNTAKEIMSEPWLYPRYLTAVAEEVCRTEFIKRTVPVGEIAEKNNWFEDKPLS